MILPLHLHTALLLRSPFIIENTTCDTFLTRTCRNLRRTTELAFGTTTGSCSSKMFPDILSSVPTPRSTTAEKLDVRDDTHLNSNYEPTTSKPTDDNDEKRKKRKKKRRRRHHMVLHFDINETILVGDDAGGDTREDSLNKILSKSAFVQIPPTGDTNNNNDGGGDYSKSRSLEVTEKLVPARWWDGSPIHDTDDKGKGKEEPSLPPLYVGWEWPPDTCPYYRTSLKKASSTFTNPNPNSNANTGEEGKGGGGDGKLYRPLYEELERRLTLPKDDQDGIPSNHPFHHMIPSFFHTLVQLQKIQRQEQQHDNDDRHTYSIVLRTFGYDLEDIINALRDFGRGKHPLHPNFRDERLVMDGTADMYRGRYRRVSNGGGSKDDGFVYDLLPWVDENNKGDDDDDADKDRIVASGDERVLNVIENCNTICGIQDDYDFWYANGYTPWSGKPVWVRRRAPTKLGGGEEEEEEEEDVVANRYGVASEDKKVEEGVEEEEMYVHHIIFDDNIHNDPTDSIVAVRMVEEEEDDDDDKDSNQNYDDETTCTTTKKKKKKKKVTYRALDGEETLEQHGKHIIRVPTIAAILDENWFLKKIREAEEAIHHSAN